MKLEFWRLGYARFLRGVSAIELVVLMGVCALTYVTLISHQQREIEQESLTIVAKYMERIADSAVEFRMDHGMMPWPNSIGDLPDMGVSAVNIASRYGGTFTLTNAPWQQGGGVQVVGRFTAANNDAAYLDTFYRSGDLLHIAMQRRHGNARVLYERIPASEGQGYQVSLLITDEEFSRRPGIADGTMLALQNSPRTGYVSRGPVNLSNVLSIGNLSIGSPGAATVGNYQQCGFCRVFNNASEADLAEGGDLVNTAMDSQGASYGVWVNSLNHTPGQAPPDFNSPYEVLANRIVSTGIRFQAPTIGSLGPVTLQLNETEFLDLPIDAVLSAPVAYMSEPWGISDAHSTVDSSHYSRILNTRNHVRVVAENSIVFNNTTLWNTVGLDCSTMTVNWLFYYSDERMKNVTGVLDGKNAIDAVRRTPMYHYDWRESDSKGIGLLAQDVANIDGVGARARGGMHGVSQSGMIATVWSAVDELAEVTADLEKKADLLHSQIKKMREEKRVLMQISAAEMRARP